MKLERLIVDANVLIDFCKTEKSVLALVTKHIGKAHVAEPVLAEVHELDRSGAKALGLHVLDVEFSAMSRAAAASVRSPLSFKDWLCLHLAEENAWTCVTNDKRLRVRSHQLTIASPSFACCQPAGVLPSTLKHASAASQLDACDTHTRTSSVAAEVLYMHLASL